MEVIQEDAGEGEEDRCTLLELNCSSPDCYRLESRLPKKTATEAGVK